MGYNLTVHSITRQLPQLEQLLSERRTLDFPTGNPRRLAYKIREAIKASIEHSDTYGRFAPLDYLYILRELPGAVRAEYIGEPEGTPVGRSPTAPPTNIHPERKTFSDVQNLLEVLAVAAKFNAPDQELYFPSAVLPPTDKLKLYNWTLTRDWTYIDHSVSDGAGGMTLTKKPVPNGVAWTPEGEEDA